MAKSLSVSKSYGFLGGSYQAGLTVSADNAAVAEPVGGVAAAQTGVLTTRSSGTAGTVTMDSGGHTITTGIRVDVYWSGGVAYGATVGTVSGTSVPFTLAQGDALPAATTAVRVSIPDKEAMAVSYTAAVAAIAYAALAGSDYPATVVFADSGNNTLAVYKPTAASPAAAWEGTSVSTNPFASDVAFVFLSHGNSDAARTVGGGVLFN